jgi:hypothetical protein
MSNESRGALQVSPEVNGLPEALLNEFGERTIGNAVLATPGTATRNTTLRDSALTTMVAGMLSIQPTDAIEKARRSSSRPTTPPWSYTAEPGSKPSRMRFA